VWELLRTSILAAEDAKSIDRNRSDRRRVLRRYRKTTAAMVHDMDILLEELMSIAAARTAAPPAALTIQQLEAFMAELKTLYQVHGSAVTRGLIHYLLGSNGADYYKMIHYNHRITRVIPFNLFGSLNQASNSGLPETAIPPIDLPTKIIDISLKEDSQTTVILTMDNGWSISFRIHSASTIVEPSLKFDIQLIGQPANLFFLDVAW
jgi:hypothetical protein